MELKAHHWLFALLSAIATHLALLHLLERPTTPPAPAPGILIELTGDAGQGTSGPQSLSPLGVEDFPEAEPVALQEMESDAVSEVPAQEVDATQTAVPEERIPQTEVIPLAQATALVAEPPTSKTRPLATRPKAKPKKSKKARTTKNKKSPSEPRRNKGPRRTGTPQTGNAKGNRRKGPDKRTAGSSASQAAAKSRYAGQVSAWLNRHKRYPKRARRRGEQGTVTVRFTVDRNGRVLSSNIVRSSGHRALADEVLALMRRGRMPAMPAAMTQRRMTMTVPIRFRLR